MSKKLIFVHYGFMDVSGSTEAFYMYNEMQKYYDVTAITSEENIPKEKGDIKAVPTEKYKMGVIPERVIFEFFVLIESIKIIGSKDDIVWSYKESTIAPFLLKILFGVKWIADVQAAPARQAAEVSREEEKYTLRKKVYMNIIFYINKVVLRYSDFVISVSDTLKKYLIDTYNLKEEKTYVLSLGVDPQKFSPKRNIKTNKSLNLGCVSSFNRARKPEILIGIMRELKSKGIDGQLYAVGPVSKEYLDELKNMSKKYEVSNRITWTGYVKHEKIPKILDLCDIGLAPLPNIPTYQKSSPAKIFEYLAMELVVIASDLPGTRSVIEHGKNGFLAKSYEPKEWVRLINKVSDSKEKMAALKAEARRSIKDHTWSKKARKVKNTIEKI